MPRISSTEPLNPPLTNTVQAPAYHPELFGTPEHFTVTFAARRQYGAVFTRYGLDINLCTSPQAFHKKYQLLLALIAEETEQALTQLMPQLTGLERLAAEALLTGDTRKLRAAANRAVTLSMMTVVPATGISAKEEYP